MRQLLSQNLWQVLVKKLLSRFSLADMILIVVGIIAIIVSATGLWQHKEQMRVYIHKNNRLWGIYSLDRDKTIEIDSHNTLNIKNGKVAVTFSDCPDKRCVKQGYTNILPVVCLPNELMVEIKSNDKDTRLIMY